jgi:hypothetical protein
MGDVADGWIGTAPGDAPADRAERSPSLVVSTAHSALGAVRRLQVRVGEVTVLLSAGDGGPLFPGGGTPLSPGGGTPLSAGGGTPLSPGGGTPRGAGPAAPGWVRDAVTDELDIGAHLAAELDLVGRGAEDAPERRWAGTLPVSRYAAFRTADPADADALARSADCPAELVRALARPVALSRVEVVRRDGAARGTGPTTVVTDELAWVDGGDDGLWTVRPDGPDEVAIGRGTPAEVAAELAGMVRAAEGC